MTGLNWLHFLHDNLNHDFCPWANRWVYWMKNPFWIMLAGTVTAVLCGLLVSPIVLALGAGLAAVLALGVIWPWLTVYGVQGHIRFAHTRGRVGEPVLVEIELVNRWPWPAWGLELERGFRIDHDETSRGLVLAYVSGWSTTRFVWKFQPGRRGVYPVDSPQVETSFPFGLYRSGRRIAAENELIVWPRSTQLDALPDAVEIESREDRTSDRRPGDLGDMLGTRSFREGDSLRRVHWAQSARQSRLIVCERQAPVSCALRLVLDLLPEHHVTSGSDNSIERQLSVAASIVESLHREHAHVVCIIGSETHNIGCRAAELKRCLDALARVPSEGIGTDCTRLSRYKFKPRQRILVDFVLTTPVGLISPHRRWPSSEKIHFVVTGSRPSNAKASENIALDGRPWLELSSADDVLGELSRKWRRACRDN